MDEEFTYVTLFAAVESVYLWYDTKKANSENMTTIRKAHHPGKDFICETHLVSRILEQSETESIQEYICQAEKSYRVMQVL